MKDPLSKNRHCITRENQRLANITRANTLYRGDIERIVWKETGVPLKYCRQIIKEAVKQLMYYLAMGHKFGVPYFGTLRPYRTRTGTGKVVNSVQFSPNWTMVEKLILGEGYKRTTYPSQVPGEVIKQKLEDARASLAVEKVPFRHRYVKSWKTEIEENLELAKPDKWAKKKRRK